MRYAVHDAAGRILKTGTAPDAMLATLQQVEQGTVLVLEDHEECVDTTHYVDAGTVVAMPVRPSNEHVFDYGAKAWIDPRTLVDLKGEKWAAIKADRATAEFGGFVWDGSSFDSDAISQSRIQGCVQLALLAATAGQAFEIDWTLATNEVRTLSGADVVAVGQALGTHVANQHATARVLRLAIEAAEDAPALDAIVWPEPT
jgi:hypothetical protein